MLAATKVVVCAILNIFVTRAISFQRIPLKNLEKEIGATGQGRTRIGRCRRIEILNGSVEIETTKAVGGSLYSELGSGRAFAIVGVSRTNLKPLFDLFWDPSESVQLGVAYKISSYDRIQAYTIFDVRLHTGQQNTHVLWRHKLNANNGITFDGVFKSGHTDSGELIHNVGMGVYYDRPRWFWKLNYDPHVNFSNRTMIRTGIGMKF